MQPNTNSRSLWSTPWYGLEDKGHIESDAVGLNKSWALLWLQLLQAAAAARTTSLRGIKPDFLFAKLGGSADAPHFWEPMSRDEALVMLRQCLYECYRDVPVDCRPDLTFTGVHSFKVTFLSYAKQLGLPEGFIFNKAIIALAEVRWQNCMAETT